MLQHFIQKLLNFKKSKSGFGLAFEENFGFYPGNEALYHIAFTHRSDPSSNSDNIAGSHNERLEFLGDSVISTIVSDYLFHQFPDADEGQLTKMRSKLVKRDNLNQWAKTFDIPRFLQHDKGLTNNQQFKDTVYGNAFEAFIGAMYLDQGFDFTHYFIKEKILVPYVNLKQLQSEESNFKSRLIEWGQQAKKQVNFEISSHEDSDNMSIFNATVYIGGEEMGTGQAKRKKAAEQEAAKAALDHLEQND